MLNSNISITVCGYKTWGVTYRNWVRGGLRPYRKDYDMELIQEYMNRAVKVNGVYVLRVDENMTLEEMDNLMEHWDSMGMKEPLMIFPMQFTINYTNDYAFFLAMMLVRQHKITRKKWVREYKDGITGIPYLTMCDDILVRGYEDYGPTPFSPYVCVKEDMDATDWIFYDNRSNYHL